MSNQQDQSRTPSFLLPKLGVLLLVVLVIAVLTMGMMA